MDTMEVIVFHPKHLEVAAVRQHELDTIFKMKNAYAQIEKLAAVSKQAGTFMYDGRVITCAGFMEMWQGVAEVWQIPTQYVKTCPTLFAKTMRGYIETIADQFKYHRVQTVAPADALHDRWMTWLGFIDEGTMQMYTADKRNYRMWARTFQWA